MKKSLSILFCLVTVRKEALVISLFFVLSNVLFAQSTGDYRSAVSGNWNAATTWETYDGASWVAATIAPASTDSVITIRSTNIVTVDTATTADQIVIESGGSLVVSVGDTLTIANGSDSVDCIVYGSVLNYGTLTTTGRISFENNSAYYHLVPAGGGTVPTSTWRDGSTCEIDSAGNGGTTTPSNITAQSFYNFTWNCPRVAGNIGLNFPDNYVFRGNFTMTNNGGTNRQWRLTNLGTGQTKNIYIRGDVIVNGSNGMLTGTGSGADTLAKVIINVDGDINVSAGLLSLTNSGNAYAQWKIKGNVNITGGTLGSGGGAWRRTISFTKSGTQNFTLSGGKINTYIKYTVDTNAVVQLNSSWSVDGELILNGGKIISSSVDTLSIQTGSSITGGNSLSYVDGPLMVNVATSSPATLNFPIGKESVYRPIGLNLTMDASTTTSFTAEVFNSAASARVLPSSLKAVSSSRYFSIVKGTGASLISGTATLSYGIDDTVWYKDSVRVVNDDGAGNWLNIGGSGTADTIGTITSNVVSSFGETFTLGYVAPDIVIVVPALTTTEIDTATISTTTANGGGNVTNDGGGAVTARGVCWNTTGSPTISDSITSDGNGTGIFASALSGLAAGTKYYVCAYATNSAGTAYGNEVTFTTLAALVVPTVTTSAVTNIVNTSARGGGQVLAWGGTPVTERGVCWSVSHNPTIADEYNKSGSGLGTFTVSIAGLSLSTTYYVRSYAINSTGTGYGEEVSFTTPDPQPDVIKIVSQDGRGDYTTIQAAFDAVTSNYTGKWYIYVLSGTYYEKMLLSSGKINVVLVGQNKDSTILTYDDYSGKAPGIGTSTSYSIAIDADDFEAQNITFRNTSTTAQAVALRSNGDRQEYYDCNILGFQDTYYTYSGGRDYLKNCLVQGSVDFVFGGSVAVFDSCRINCNRNGGTLTAAATGIGYKFGYVFTNCTITSDSIGFDSNPITSFTLGRPWQNAPQTVFLTSYEPATLAPAGWSSWNVTPALYAEYKCYGPGSDTTNRIKPLSRQLIDSEATTYTISNIFGKNTPLIPYGANWVPSRAAIDTTKFILVSIHEVGTAIVAKEFRLANAYPNPFNPTTKLQFTVEKNGWASLSVYNILGQKIKIIFEGNISAGKVYESEFHAEGLSSGMYFACLESNGKIQIKKLILMK